MRPDSLVERVFDVVSDVTTTIVGGHVETQRESLARAALKGCHT